MAERIYRKDKHSAEAIYDQSVIEYLRDGVTILPGVINIDLLEQFDRDLTNISNPEFPEAKKAAIKIDGSDDHYKARHLLNLNLEDFRTEKPGLKLCDMHRHFDSAKELAFSPAITGFMEALFGSPAALIQSLTFWKSSEQPEHQDFSYVHHHSKLAHLAAAWIPLEDINADAGPLVYYKGSHFPDMHGFFDWGEGSILASRAVEKEIYENYQRHLIERIDKVRFQTQYFPAEAGRSSDLARSPDSWRDQDEESQAHPKILCLPLHKRSFPCLYEAVSRWRRFRFLFTCFRSSSLDRNLTLA